MRHIFLTGAPGVGKSTLIMRLTERLRNEVPHLRMCGFRTDEVRRKPGGRLGFDVIMVQGTRKPLARINEEGKGGPQVGRYLVDIPSFESLALPELQHAAQGGPGAESPTLCVMDEIGKMELFSRPFFPAVRQVLSQSRGVVALGTIPLQKPGQRVLKEVAEVSDRADVTVVVVSPQNRDALVSELYELLKQRLTASCA